MTNTIHRQLTLPYTASQLFALVNDIEQYQYFLPWCKESRILTQSTEQIQAVLVLTAGGMQKSFTTLNRLALDKRIDISLIEGPFKHLAGTWQFQAIDAQTTTVQLDLAFEFSSRLLSLAFSKIFQQAIGSLMDAFALRAQQLYGA